MPILTIWSFRLRDMKNLMKFFWWEDILILGILDLKQAQMTTEEDLSLAFKQWDYYWRIIWDLEELLDLLHGVERNGQVQEMEIKHI